MKALRLLLATLALAALTFTAQAAEKAPALPIEQALKLAQGYLQRNDPKGVIVGLTLEKGALLGGTQRWYAKWAAPIRRDGKTEIGLEIAMDGTLTRVVGRGALVLP